MEEKFVLLITTIIFLVIFLIAFLIMGKGIEMFTGWIK